ncbi:hypothetical protein BDY19DRAFT_889736 [Irpex rosettiformis]|uniref:Uncharacterized protein n=1 Tax=Irpex rosettiformis TaxID=378272 RepID=A0ACB8U453_9APHY|nr:hypothetical protein BDY19DRAFT_889736 [Irpex rosettiformis]
MSGFESLPVELIAEILGELDLTSLILVSYLSRRLHAIASDPSLNPWRRPILRNLRLPLDELYETCLKTLSVRQTVPRHNWVEIISLARAEWLLFDATLPRLNEWEWEECFKRRFLPGWQKWKKENTSWQAAFLKILHRIWHRSHTICTADESWTRYIILRRNGVANELQSASRNFDPLTIFDDLKLQANLDHLPTRVRLAVELTDVRIIALGVLNKPRGPTTVNPNAQLFLHPPGIEKEVPEVPPPALSPNGTEGAVDNHDHPPIPVGECYCSSLERDIYQIYRKMTYPLPARCHAEYPFYTPSGEDKRWIVKEDLEEEGLSWVGPLMITVQVIGPRTKEPTTDHPLQDWDLVDGTGRSQYASFGWADLAAIAPWLDIPKKIDGAGLGNE